MDGRLDIDEPPTKKCGPITVQPPTKTTLLGAQQARRRLFAFSSSLLKRNALLGSPTTAKKAIDKQEKKLKKENAQSTVIEEIEQLKKAEDEMKVKLESQIKRMENKDKRKEDKHRRVNKKRKKRSRSPSPTTKQKYPANWSELLEMRLELSDLKTLKSSSHYRKNSRKCVDYRKHLAFERTSFVPPVQAQRIKKNDGQEIFLPPFNIRFTKHQPSLPYSTNSKFLQRKEIFSELPHALLNTCQKILNGSKKLSDDVVFMAKSRFWYPETIFGGAYTTGKIDNKILEPSLSLLVLKNYSDVEEETNAKVVGVEEKQKTDGNVDKLNEIVKSKKKKKRKKRKKEMSESKEKQNKKEKKLVETILQEEEESLTPELKPKQQRNKTPSEERKSKDTIHHYHHHRSERKRSKSPKTIKIKKSKSPQTKRNKSKSPQLFVVDKTKENENTVSTPNTDEYHSLWESDEDVGVVVETKRISHSWESDEEIFGRNRQPRRYSKSPERCLEMPLNIKHFQKHPPINLPLFIEDNWENIGGAATVDEVKRLEEERRTISEERRLLQLERKKLEELERKRYWKSVSPLFDKEERQQRSPSPFYKKMEELDKLKRHHHTYSREENKKRKRETEDVMKKRGRVEIPDKNLENEYQEFMKAVSFEKKDASDLKRHLSPINSNSASSTPEMKHRKKKRKQQKKKIVDNFDDFLLEPKEVKDEFLEQPKPVPSPVQEIWQHRLVADSTSSPAKKQLDLDSNWSLDSNDIEKKLTPSALQNDFSFAFTENKKRKSPIQYNINRGSLSPLRRQSRWDSPHRRSHSPLERPKQSVADSTISDEQLTQQLPALVINTALPPPPPPPLPSVPPPPLPSPQQPIKPINYPYVNRSQPRPKIVQLGNMIEIVPTDECQLQEIQHEELQQQQKQPQQQILQIGNMLQIVPSEIPPQTEPIPPPPPQSNDNNKQQKERKLQKRKEKERKRKERERKRQQKLKARTERMIKRALLLDIEGEEDDENQENANGPWPPVPIVLNNLALKPAGKSILLSHGLSKLNIKEGGENVNENKKSVKFADGICPGEGTSPSAGEELSSPPPPTRKVSKEKRYKKLKAAKRKSKKKKVKVKVIRKLENTTTAEENDDDDDDGDEEDNLPPPPPPPGSPPPHIFPPRVKSHTINNVHPSNFFAQPPLFRPQQQQPPAPPPPLTFNIPPPTAMVHHSPAVIHPVRQPF